ncbi:MAG: hypothetical protein KAY27_02980 [Pedobacter sp.]|nr:hypothetical protein [Pedobacter sp.]
MKKLCWYVWSIALLLSIYSCEKANKTIVYPVLPGLPAPTPLAVMDSDIKVLSAITYGTSGMCGPCRNNLVITGLSATLNTTEVLRNGTTLAKTCQKSFTESDIDGIRRLLNTKEMSRLPEVNGCPGCADAEEWIEVTADGKTYKFRFSYSEVPKEIRPAVLKIRQLRSSFTDCK